jgi:hypothetical protein
LGWIVSGALSVERVSRDCRKLVAAAKLTTFA